MKIAAVMATRFDPPQREPLLELLRADGVVPVVMADVGPHAPDWSLYRLWNNGVRYAIENVGADYVCVLNDDVKILPGTLEYMARALDVSWTLSGIDDVPGVVYPNAARLCEQGRGMLYMTPTTGTHGSRAAMTGFCFMFRAELDVPFDESYRLWYGDDDFEERVRAKGLLVCRIDGLPIDHVEGYSTRQLPDADVTAMIEHDRALWDSRHAAVPV